MVVMTNTKDTPDIPQEAQEAAPTITAVEVQGYVIADSYSGVESVDAAATPEEAQEFVNQLNAGQADPGRYHLRHRTRFRLLAG